MSPQNVIALSEGQISLDAIAQAISSASARRGIPDHCDIRSVLVMGQGGKWVNHCTVLHVGSTLAPLTEDPIDRIVGNARLVGANRSAQSIDSSSELVEFLTTWRIALPQEFLRSVNEGKFGPAVQEPPWSFQANGNAYHHSSHNEWGDPPRWVIDLYDRRGSDVGTVIPRSIYRDKQSGEFAPDLGTLVKNWCKDPTLGQFTSIQNAYRVVIPDLRGFIDHVELYDKRVAVFVVVGKAAGLKCALTTVDQKRNGSSETKAVSNERVEFEVGDLVHSLEIHLIDDSDEWCDHYWRSDVGTLLTTVAQKGELAAEDELLKLLLAPRYAAVRAQLAKAIAFFGAEQQDFANAAKEAICAVESAARIMSGWHEMTLGQIVKALKKEKRIEPADSVTLNGLWVHASNLPGVRHGAIMPSDISEAECRLLLDKSRNAIRFFLEKDV